MTLRVLFLYEGPGDDAIATHIERIAVDCAINVVISAPRFAELDTKVGRKVRQKFRKAVELGGPYDLVVVHRDEDGATIAAREKEVGDAIAAEAPGTPFVAVVPVHMTEAWLLTSESEIRRVAGNPNGRVALNLPKPKHLERNADPKTLLWQVLVIASDEKGKRLKDFKERFGNNRRLLLERLDPHGPVTALPSWRKFVADVETGLRRAADARR